jgi:hypothetical protein
MLSVRRAIAVTGLLGACGALTAAEHDSWPQWGGPNRNFHVAAESGAWPEGGLPIVWQRDLDEGYSGVVASRRSLFTLGRSGDIERVIALSAQTGKTQWTYEYKAALPAWMRTNHGVGPRSTPLLIGDRLFTASWTLLCLSVSGALVWRQISWRTSEGAEQSRLR